jgi:hypothetical protein
MPAANIRASKSGVKISIFKEYPPWCSSSAGKAKRSLPAFL